MTLTLLTQEQASAVAYDLYIRMGHDPELLKDNNLMQKYLRDLTEACKTVICDGTKPINLHLIPFVPAPKLLIPKPPKLATSPSTSPASSSIPSSSKTIPISIPIPSWVEQSD